MKKLALAMMMGVAALSSNAQVNYQMKTACHPQDFKTYDTQRIRENFLMEKVFSADEINLTYAMYDRFISSLILTGIIFPSENMLCWLLNLLSSSV